MISFKGAHFPPDIILTCVCWYVAYPLSYRHVEELREERGVPIDHATIQRWVVKYSPQLELDSPAQEHHQFLSFTPTAQRYGRLVATSSVARGAV